jgi:microsomal dipeptidase-like Zn-dependent dipeptidase
MITKSKTFKNLLFAVTLSIGCSQYSLQAQSFTMQDVQNIFDSSFVFELNGNYYVREDSNCNSNCTRKPYPGFAPYDFSTIKNKIGLSGGAISIGSEGSMNAQRNSSLNGTFQNTRVILSQADLDSCAFKDKKKYGIMFYVQSRLADNNYWQLDGDISLIEDWYDDGLRILQMAYGSNENNDSLDILGYGSDEEDSLGVTALGELAIKKMNDLRMVVDVSHCNKQTTLDACKLSKRPVIATHANCLAVTNSLRNKGDDEIIAIANSKGLMGITPIRSFFTSQSQGTMKDFIAHIEHVVNLVGIDYVGLGKDSYLDGWDSGSYYHPGLELNHKRWMINVAYELLNNYSYSVEDVQKLIGKNAYRVLSHVFSGDELTSTQTIKMPNILGYPTSVKDVFYLNTFGKKLDQMTVTDMNGKKVQLQVNSDDSLTKFNFSELPTGVYIVKGLIQNQAFHLKIVKQ